MLKIFYRANEAVVEGLADSNGHRRKVVGEGESFSWGGKNTKLKWRKCKLTKNLLFHIDLLKLRWKKKHNITEFFPDINVFNE